MLDRPTVADREWWLLHTRRFSHALNFVSHFEHWLLQSNQACQIQTHQNTLLLIYDDIKAGCFCSVVSCSGHRRTSDPVLFLANDRRAMDNCCMSLNTSIKFTDSAIVLNPIHVLEHGRVQPAEVRVRYGTRQPTLGTLWMRRAAGRSIAQGHEEAAAGLGIALEVGQLSIRTSWALSVVSSVAPTSSTAQQQRCGVSGRAHIRTHLSHD